jgi:hypothetical protein
LKGFKTLIALAFLAVLSPSTMAALVEAGWPPPGGASHTVSGDSPARQGGKTFTISGFDDFFYDELYYSIHPLGTGDNSTDSMIFNPDASDLANGVSVWDSTIDIYNEQSAATMAVTGKFVLTVKDARSKALPLVEASSLGLDPNLGGMLRVTDDFVSNWSFHINDSSALPWHNNPSIAPDLPPAPKVENTFYYSRTDIPVPTALWLFGSALFGLLTISRRTIA